MPYKEQIALIILLIIWIAVVSSLPFYNISTVHTLLSAAQAQD